MEPGAVLGDYLIAIPNGGKRSAVTAALLKAEGVKAGVSDLELPLARSGWHGLWVELKRTDGGELSKEQAAWIRRMRRAGYAAECCHGWEAAAGVIRAYLAGGYACSKS